MVTVLVPLAEGFEDLEAITIVDLLRRARIQVVTAGLAPGPVQGSRGTVVTPDVTLDQALNQEFDMVVLPGGQPGATNLENDPRISGLLQKTAAAGKHTAAICAAPKVLATAGLLKDKRATSFPGALDSRQFPDIKLESLPVVTDGKVVTSRGPGTTIDFALTLIEILIGTEKREEVEAALQR